MKMTVSVIDRAQQAAAIQRRRSSTVTFESYAEMCRAASDGGDFGSDRWRDSQRQRIAAARELRLLSCSDSQSTEEDDD